MGAGFTLLAVVVALLIPREATKKFESFMGVKDTSAPFVDRTADLDKALQTGVDIAVSAKELQALLIHVAVRRLAASGRLAADEIPKIQKIWSEYAGLEASEKKPAGKAAVRDLRNRAVGAALPRFEVQKVVEVLELLQHQTDMIQPRYASKETDCAGCHFQTDGRVLERPIDTIGIWPHLPADTFGSSFPVLTETVEAAAQAPSNPCLSCHVPHGEPGFLTTLAQRQESMGVWAHAYRIEDLIYVQVKIQNKKAAHYVPAGFLNHAYAVVVDAYASAEPGGERLKYWWGSRLPKELQSNPDEGGYLMARRLVNKAGQPSADLKQAVDILDDTRLEPGRFVDLTFLFEIPRDRYTPYSVVARLVYLPDQGTLKGAEDIEVRIRSSEGAQTQK
jgi:hypothetical protein